MNLQYLLFIAVALSSAVLTIGAMVLSKRSISKWAFIAGVLLFGVEGIFHWFSLSSAKGREFSFHHTMQIIVMNLSAAVWLLFSLSYARREPKQYLIQWRLPLLIASGIPLVGFIFQNRLIAFSTEVDVLRTAHWIVRYGNEGIFLNFLYLVNTIVIVMNLERTFRAAVGTMRWRIKFMIVGVGLIFVVRAFSASQILLFQEMDVSKDYSAFAFIVAMPLLLRALVRAGKVETDVYLSHTFLYNSITLLLAGIYLLIVGLFAKVVSSLGGDQALPIKTLFILVSLLVLTILLLSDRIRMRIRRFIALHFRRPHHDFGKVWLQFTRRTGSCIDKKELCREVVKLTADIFQTLSVSIWLIDESKESIGFTASTSLSISSSEFLKLPSEELKQVIHGLKEAKTPLTVTENQDSEKWLVLLTRHDPDAFGSGNGKIFVKFQSGNALLGFMTLSDRVGELEYGPEDFDLLQCICDQVSASLLNIQLANKLAQSKELEAFQAMSAFFVHDLKNTASTLNLMLVNLPKHFDDPDFRTDALRGISKSVDHLNDLIRRLGQLRQSLKIETQEADLNELVLSTLTAWRQNPRVNIITQLQEIPKVPLDRDQVTKVVTNLVLNATEAESRAAEIKVKTSKQNGWVVLSIADNGCGMSPEFLNQSLFRPFQSSKQGGLGIGMFHSKMIVEAHGGKIEVESELGKGSCFRILLPHLSNKRFS